jgi:hypothetical protein
LDTLKEHKMSNQKNPNPQSLQTWRTTSPFDDALDCLCLALPFVEDAADCDDYDKAAVRNLVTRIRNLIEENE